MKIVCISDTHRPLPATSWPEGDVLVHAGDHTMMGTEPELLASLKWLASAPYDHKLLVWGNHDNGTQTFPLLWTMEAERLGLEVLHPWDIHRVDGLNFAGSPYSVRVGHGWAWQLDRGASASAHWSAIPVGTDVLVTHGPPLGVGDLVPHATDGPNGDGHVGDYHLHQVFQSLPRLKLMVVGHIHEGYGNYGMVVNASQLDAQYRHVNKPIVVEL